MRKIVCLILTLIVLIACVTMLVCCKQTQSTPPTPQDNDSYALFIYMSGADLESNSGAGSAVIDKILATDYSDNVQVYIMTGGASKWKNTTIPNDKVIIYQAKDGKLNVINKYPLMSMGDANTLSEFVYFSSTVTANKKVLLMWGHGSSYGICPDQLFDNDMLTYTEFRNALYYYSFDMIMFSACYTANIDLMTYISDNAHYAIASEEVLPSIGYDYQAMLQLFDNNGKADIKDIGKQIIDSTLSKYQNSSLKDTLTLTLVDLAKLKTYIVDIEGLYYDLLYQHTVNKWLKSLTLANSIGSSGKDLIDVINHYGLSNYYYRIILNDIILYEIHGTRYDTGGLYIYYEDDINSYNLKDYKENCAYDNYYTIIKNLVDIRQNDYINFLSYTNSGNSVINAVTDELLILYGSYWGYTIYDNDKKPIRVDTLCINDSYNDTDGKTHIAVHQDALFQLTLGGIRLDYTLYTKQESYTSSESKHIYTADVTVNGQVGKLCFQYQYTHDFDKVHNGQLDGEYTMLGFLPTSGGQWYDMQQLVKGDVIVINGQSITYDNQPILRAELPSGYYISITVVDIFGKTYNTPMLLIKNN